MNIYKSIQYGLIGSSFLMLIASASAVYIQRFDVVAALWGSSFFALVFSFFAKKDADKD